MTTASPEFVKYSFYARVGSTDLPVTAISASMDRDRLVYCTATIECDWIDDATFTALDPRKNPIPKVSWNVEQFNESGTRIGQLPNETSSGTPVKASMWVRSVTRDPVSMTSQIRIAGGESLMQDKMILEIEPYETGSADVRDLIWWSLDDIFGSYSITFTGTEVATAVPGDRSLAMPGESHIDLLAAELSAIDHRLSDQWGIAWYSRLRTATGTTNDYATYVRSPNTSPVTDPIVYEYTETLSRDGDWYDGALVGYDTTESGGGIEYWRSSLGGVPGANTRGKKITVKRARPSGNGATKTADRMKIRGYDLDIRARARFDIDAISQINVHIPGPSTRSGNVRSVQWDITEDDATMTIKAQTGDAV